MSNLFVSLSRRNANAAKVSPLMSTPPKTEIHRKKLNKYKWQRQSHRKKSLSKKKMFIVRAFWNKFNRLRIFYFIFRGIILKIMTFIRACLWDSYACDDEGIHYIILQLANSSTFRILFLLLIRARVFLKKFFANYTLIHESNKNMKPANKKLRYYTFHVKNLPSRVDNDEQGGGEKSLLMATQMAS